MADCGGGDPRAAAKRGFAHARPRSRWLASGGRGRTGRQPAHDRGCRTGGLHARIARSRRRLHASARRYRRFGGGTGIRLVGGAHRRNVLRKAARGAGGGSLRFSEPPAGRNGHADIKNVSDERLRDMAEALPQIVWITDASGMIEYYSRRWFEYSGASTDNSDPKHWRGFVHPEDFDRLISSWRDAAALGRSWQAEYRLRRVDGSYRWHLGQAVPVTDSDGNVIRWFGSATDIDGQKCVEVELSRTAAERARLLQQKDILLLEIQHRVRNNLQLISSLLSLQNRTITDPGTLQQFIEDRGRIQTVAQVHEQLYLTDEPDRMDFAALLREMCLNQSKPNIEVTCRRDGPLNLPIDEATPLALIANELISNAVEYAYPADGGLRVGGGEVRVFWRAVPLARSNCASRTTGSACRLIWSGIRPAWECGWSGSWRDSCMAVSKRAQAPAGCALASASSAIQCRSLGCSMAARPSGYQGNHLGRPFDSFGRFGPAQRSNPPDCYAPPGLCGHCGRTRDQHSRAAYRRGCRASGLHGCLCGHAQEFLDYVVMALRPIAGAAHSPEIDDVADQIQRVGFDRLWEV